MPTPSWSTATTANTIIIDWSNWFWMSTPTPAYLQEDVILHREQYHAACERARETLLSLLDPDNRERARLGQALRVRGSAGTEYEIHHGYTSNVKRVRDGAHFCAHPPMHDRDGNSMLPVEDVWIAQMLALQADEAAFLAVAHRSGGRP